MKIYFTGPESSGKSSVSKAVAEKIQAHWYPEFARRYLLERKGKYDFDDIAIIARLQHQERLKFATSKSFQIYDTGDLVLYIWSMFKYQKCESEIIESLQNQQDNYFFLCSPEGISWEDDPLREHPFQREELFRLFQNELEQRCLDYTILMGSEEERIHQVIERLENLL